MIPSNNVLLLAPFFLVGCEEEKIWSGDVVPADTCAFPLVHLQTGSDDSCSGGNIHSWPIGMDASDCHGWAAEDNNGDAHYNSASAISCNSDGSFSFDQYAGNLDCSGTAVTKNFYADECEQDIPPSLYTVAIDLSCCDDPNSCSSERPSVEQTGATIYLNNALCQEE